MIANDLSLVTRLIKVDGTEIPLKPKNGRTFTMEELQAAIGGGFFEIVRVFPGGERYYLVVDEDGVSKRLPVNRKASKYYPYSNSIFGDALFCHTGQIR